MNHPAMNGAFKVANGGSVSVAMKADNRPGKKFARTILKPGTIITPVLCEQCDLTPEKIEGHYRSGYLVKTNLEADPFAHAPGVDEQLILRPEEDVTTRDSRSGVTTAKGPSRDVDTSRSVTVEADNPTKITAPPVTFEGKWDLDPAAISGKPLDELNVMVAERDADVEPFETVEEAVGHLSQDYLPPAS